MPAYFESLDIIQDKYIFVSYSHEDKAVFDELTKFLIEAGVRVWTDRAFCPTDRWEEEAKGLLKHENCCGVIWLCSENSIKSEAVHKELSTALAEQKKRTEKEYPIFLVNVCSNGKPNSYMKLLKKSFDLLDIDSIDDKFKEEMLANFVTLISGGTICVMTCNEDYTQVLFDGIKSKNLGVIDKGFIVLEKMENISNNSNVVIAFGAQDENGTKKPLKWSFLRYDGEEAIFVSTEIIGEAYGGEALEQWLNGDFKNSVFSMEEASKLIKPVRLLSGEEVEQRLINDKVKDCEWWLADTHGRRQSVVRVDGTIYDNGYINVKFKKGIRPVIILDINQALEILSAQNKR